MSQLDVALQKEDEMLTALLPLIAGMVSQLPDNSGPVVQTEITPEPAPQQRFVGLHQTPAKPGTPPAQAGAGEQPPAGVTPGVQPPPGQPSPSPASTVIDRTAFYVLDQNNPDERVIGNQLLEMAQRGRQVDDLQRQLHTTQNEHTGLAEQLRLANAELQRLRTEATVGRQLASAGVLPQQPPPQQVPVTPTGVQQNQGTEGTGDIYDRMAEQWGPSTPNSMYGYTEEPAPQQAPQQQPVPAQMQNPSPVTPTQGASLVGDPKALAQELLPVLSQLVKNEMGNINQLVDQRTQAGFQQLQRDEQARNQIASTLSQTREMRSQGLTNMGMDPGIIKNTIDLEDAARVLEREAEGLLATNTPDNVIMAQEKIRQAAQYGDRASQNRVEAQVVFNTGQQQRVFDAAIETNPYQALGIDKPNTPDLNLKDPRAIAQANAENLSMATQIVEERDRIDRTAGRM